MRSVSDDDRCDTLDPSESLVEAIVVDIDD